VVERGAMIPAGVSVSAADHRTENRYDAIPPFGTREEFLASAFFGRWVHEAHRCYKRALHGATCVLSIGAGVGEHDVLLHLAGFRVISTDLIPNVSRATASLFSEMTFASLDVFDREALRAYRCDAVLFTGLDYALDDTALGTALENVKLPLARLGLIEPRVVFTLRYRDNLLTRVIDDVLLPVEARLRQMRRGSRYHVVAKAHGYRRSPVEFQRLAARCGFRTQAVCYAGDGVEFGRSAILRRIPGLTRLDRRLHVASNCIVFQLVQSGDTSSSVDRSVRG
jgi:hypothetical protein